MDCLLLTVQLYGWLCSNKPAIDGTEFGSWNERAHSLSTDVVKVVNDKIIVPSYEQQAKKSNTMVKLTDITVHSLSEAVTRLNKKNKADAPPATGNTATLYSHFNSAKVSSSNPMHNGSDEYDDSMSMETHALSASGGDSGDDTEDGNYMETSLLGASTSSITTSIFTFFGGKSES